MLYRTTVTTQSPHPNSMPFSLTVQSRFVTDFNKNPANYLRDYSILHNITTYNNITYDNTTT